MRKSRLDWFFFFFMVLQGLPPPVNQTHPSPSSTPATKELPPPAAVAHLHFSPSRRRATTVFSICLQPNGCCPPFLQPQENLPSPFIQPIRRRISCRTSSSSTFHLQRLTSFTFNPSSKRFQHLHLLQSSPFSPSASVIPRFFFLFSLCFSVCYFDFLLPILLISCISRFSTLLSSWFTNKFSIAMYRIRWISTLQLVHVHQTPVLQSIFLFLCFIIFFFLFFFFFPCFHHFIIQFLKLSSCFPVFPFQFCISWIFKSFQVCLFFCIFPVFAIRHNFPVFTCFSFLFSILDYLFFHWLNFWFYFMYFQFFCFYALFVLFFRFWNHQFSVF